MTGKFQINTPTLTNKQINIALTYRVKIEETPEAVAGVSSKTKLLIVQYVVDEFTTP